MAANYTPRVPGPIIRTDCQSERINRGWIAAHNRIALLDLMQETKKHRLRVEAAIVAKTVFVQVSLQIVLADGVIDAANAVFDEAPKSLNGIRVNFAHHIDFLAVIDPPMNVLVVMPIHHVVRREVIGKHGALGKDMLFDQPEHRGTFHIVSDHSSDATLALNHSNDRCFLVREVASHRTPSAALAPTAHKHLVHLHAGAMLPTQRRSFFIIQHRANLFEHSPRGFIGHARFALNLFSGNTVARRSHQVNRIEPSRERGGGLVKDRVSSWVNVMPAVITRIRWTAFNAVMFRDRLARIAKDAVRVETILEPFQTGRVVWEHFLEIFLGEAKHLWFAVTHGERTYV